MTDDSKFDENIEILIDDLINNLKRQNTLLVKFREEKDSML